MASNNSKRGPNFSVKEIEKLVQLVKMHWNIINNKGTDAATNALKIDAWKAIERTFNKDEACSIYRPHYVLRTKFDNLKRLRKKTSSTPKNSKSNDGAVPNSSPTDDVDYDCFDSFKSAVTAKVRKSGYENFDLSFTDSSSEPVEFSEPVSGSSVRSTVTAFFQEPERKYFIKEIDDYEDIPGGEEEEFEWQRVSVNDIISDAQDSCITQSTGESLSKKRKCDESLSVPKRCKATESIDLRKQAFLEKHNLTLQLLKEEAEQRMKHEAILHELREEELRLRIKFMKDKHEAELNLMKANRTQNEET